MQIGRKLWRWLDEPYAINTIGAIAGAFITGFVLIPKTSTKFTLIVASAICLIVAGVAYQPAATLGDLALRRALSVGLTACARRRVDSHDTADESW